MGRNGEECCMCGDYGLSSQLFKCKHCGFRSQHKYCSNLYPSAESYHTCNWCLSQNEAKKRDDQVNNNNMIITKTSSPNYSSHHRKEENGNIIIKMKNKKRVSARDKTGDQTTIKPADNESRSGPSERIIRRTRSEEIPNGSRTVVKQVLRNKVRRYKHLDEVSC